jgi:hypothetical protein
MTLRATVLPVVSSRASGSPVGESGDAGLPSRSVELSGPFVIPAGAHLATELPLGTETHPSVPVLLGILAAQAVFFLIILAVCVECQR